MSQIICANILEWAATYDGPKFHALLCDAPYHLTEITDRFGAEDAAPAQFGKDGTFQRLSKGFMGKRWDGVGEDGIGIAFNPETWKAIAQHLHPGAFLFVFAGTLNDDLISMAMRAAGLRKHHKALAWGYGSGFPKATNIATQIDAAAFRDWLAVHPREQAILRGIQAAARAARKARQPYHALEARAKRAAWMLKRRAGLLPQVVGQRKHQPKFAAAELGYREKDNGYNSRDRESFDVTAPATELAAVWQGHRYGLQAIKPAIEPILIFQKPYEGAALDCMTRTGAGAINVDGGRIAGSVDFKQCDLGRNGGIWASNGRNEAADHPAGRWPANLILSHHPDCAPLGAKRVKNPSGSTINAGPRANAIYGADNRPRDNWTAYGDADGMETVQDWRCVEDCPVRQMGAQSGNTEATRSVRVDRNTRPGYEGGWQPLAIERGHDDNGTAARFFFNADYVAERLEVADAVVYEAKASQAEREAGLDPRQVALSRQMEAREIWASQVQDQSTPAEADTPQVRDITASDGTGASPLLTLCDGCRSAGRSQTAIKSTTATAINKTTGSKTLNSSMPSPTNDCTADASSETASGGSPAMCAACSSLLPQNTGISHKKGVHSTAGVDHATSDSLSAESRNEAPPVGTINDGRDIPIDNPFQRGTIERRNLHPCIKPISLIRHLASLLLPPTPYAPRRLLIPFAGAGSEMIGAQLAGWDEIVGVELEADHVAIAESRIAYWQQRGHEYGDPARPITATLRPAPAGQLDMFAGEDADHV